jgi:hypothetical protein
MAVLYVAEFSDMGVTRNAQPIQMAAQTPVAEQTVAIGGASVASSAFNAQTQFVRVHTDAICSIAFGTAPTATATKARMAAGATEYFSVPPGQSYKVAVITNV